MRFTKLSLLTTSCAPGLLALPTARRFQICVDVFAFGSAYMDLPSLGALPKYTGGQLYYYPGFAAERDGSKLRAELRCGGGGWKAWVRLGLVHGVSGRAAAVAPPAPSFPASPIAHILNAGPPPPRPAGATCRVRLRGRQSCASVAPRACASPPSSATSSSAPRVGSAQDEWGEVHFVLTQRMQLVGVSTDMTCI